MAEPYLSWQTQGPRRSGTAMSTHSSGFADLCSTEPVRWSKKQPSGSDGNDHLLKPSLTFAVITSAVLKEVSRLILGAVIATVMQLQRGGKEGQGHAALQSWLMEELSCFQRALWFP